MDKVLLSTALAATMSATELRCGSRPQLFLPPGRRPMVNHPYPGFGAGRAHVGPLGTPNENVSVCICGLIHLDFSCCTKIYPAVAHLRTHLTNLGAF